MFTTTRALTVATLAVAALAQSLQLTEECRNAINTLVKDSNASGCIGLQNIEVIAQLVEKNSTDSVIGTVNTWLSDICAAPECSESNLNTLVDVLKTSCEVELPTEVVTYYPIVRKAVCLQEASTNCITQTLTNIEKVIGTINVDKVKAFLNFEDTAVDELAKATTAYCTDCTRNIYSTIASANSTIPEHAQIGYGPVLEMQCGASFVSATNSAGGTSTTSAESSAFGGFSVLSRGVLTALSGTGIVAVSTVFAILA